MQKNINCIIYAKFIYLYYIRNFMNYSILMADIINNRREESNKLMFDLRKLVFIINKKWKKQVLSPLTITLGDEFQGVIHNLENAYKIIFDIEELIITHNLKLKLRYVLNYGKIDTPINNRIAYEMLGDGLIVAREKLNSLKKNTNRFHVIIAPDIKKQQLINDLFKLYENYIDNWKKNEYHIVREFLSGKDYQEIAGILDVNISTAWRRKKSLNIEEYNICKNLILNLNSF